MSFWGSINLRPDVMTLSHKYIQVENAYGYENMLDAFSHHVSSSKTMTISKNIGLQNGQRFWK
jgi:hypothetical protein